MLIVYSNDETYSYDINSLVKSFYPIEDMRIDCEDNQDAFLCLWIDQEKKNYRIELEPSKIRFDNAGKNPLNEDVKSDRLKATCHQAIQCEKQHEEDIPKNELKNKFKQDLYLVLQKATGRSLPWGILTGIRPTKIAMSLLEEGKTSDEIEAYMKSEYFANDEKAALSVDIAQREKKLLSGLHFEKGYSLYIGIPFCPTTCLYCSFTSYPIAAYKKKVTDYLRAVEKEIDAVAREHKAEYLDTIYIGGGTPTTLEPAELDELLTKIETTLDLSHLKEFTVEAGRPDSITRDKLKVLKAHGVTRISVNPQTMKEETLRFIGRRHTVEQTRQAFDLAREAGFDNINMDLILGLPGETAEDVANTLEEIRKLNPDSLTIHSLAIKRASRLSQWIEQNGMDMLKNTDETMSIAVTGARAMDMNPYYLYRQKNMTGNFENVGYAREGKAGLYNILIMEELQTIIAIGAGSVTKRVFGNGRIERCDNVKDVGLYIERIDEMIERKRKLFSME